MTETPRQPVTPEDITRIKWISDPQIAPDGTRVAFVMTTLSQEDDEARSQIWIVPTGSDGSQAEARPFTSGPKRDTAPRWSPDGRYVAFLSEREAHKKPQLYVMPADGGEARPLTKLDNGAGEPVWSPDGKRLAFAARVGGWQEPEDEREKRKSKPARIITTLKYKSNGEGFVYDRRPHLFVVPLEGGEPRQITDGDFNDSDPVWSPDGSAIAFCSARHADRDYDDAADVWLVSPDGGEPRRVTDTAGPLRLPSFSPDGTTLAFLGHRHLNETGRNVRLYTVPAAGGTPDCLTERLDRTCAPFFSAPRPIWQKDGSAIVVLAEDEGKISAYRIPTSGDAAPEMILGGERQVTGLSAADDRTLVFTATDPAHPAEVFVCRDSGADERRLTHLNREWLERTAISTPERFRYERAGFALDCWVMKPAGFVPGKRYPALLSVHGGPATQYGYTFFDEFQVCAGAGYAVIFTNPRGSQGYGEDFTRAVVQDWGGGDYLDVMAGLDAALERCSFIDPDRVGVLGGSYGGFMTSWIVGHTDRFKAACSERALNDHRSFFGTSDIGHFFAEQHSGSTPWDNPRWYVEHSPLTFASQVNTPLLIVHSEDDLRCPIEQGEQLYVALKKLRKDVTFVRFPDENHELSRAGKPRHRLERFRIILDWFAKYLQPGVNS